LGKKQVVELQEQLISRETILYKEHQDQIDHLIEENKVSMDTIDQLKAETNIVRIEHAKQLVVLQEEKVNVLVAQINELKVKQKNSETMKTKAMDINERPTSLQELFYAKLNEIKGQHDQLLNFTVESKI
jgi:hypothetical protein